MGWLWGSNKSTDGDPYRDLDPSLKDFLVKESPVKYTPVAPPPPPPSEHQSAPLQSTTQSAEPVKPVVPPQSLYQDGRYAHLWKTYRPLREIEDEVKSDQEKLMDVLQGYKERRAQIGRSAVENCVEEQMGLHDCYENGSVAQKLVLCRSQKKKFERCFTMQSRFLKALGYLSSYDRPASVDEKIQMHADTLYHRMLAQEKAVEEAKAAGEPIPTFPSILSPNQTPISTPESAGVPLAPDGLPPLSPETLRVMKPEAALGLRKKLKGMDRYAREAEERAVVAELLSAIDTAGEIGMLNSEVADGRKKRREEGKATVGDTVSGWFGW